MKSNKNLTGGRCLNRAYPLLIPMLFSLLFWTNIPISSYAQEPLYTRPSLWFGVAGAANFNAFHGNTQQLNSDFTAPVSFHDGTGVGLYLAPLVELNRPGALFGVMFQAGYDSRKGDFDRRTVVPCNCPADLYTDLSYITLEPSLRINPFRSDFYVFLGPRIAFNVSKSFSYQQGVNPDFPNELPEPDVNGDFSDVDKNLLSMQFGAGYDIPITSQQHAAQLVISPFVSYHPEFGQDPRAIESWTVSSWRAGAALKMGFGKKIPVIPGTGSAETVYPDVKFSVMAPKNLPAERIVREIFPLSNYIFFDTGSVQIPKRYVLLNKGQTKAFSENQLGKNASRDPSGRADRQMTVYYNVLNILGDRMVKSPLSTIKLVGSSESGPADGRAMAETVESYFVDVFLIDASRISIEGLDKPKIPSEKPGATRELDLLREGDRRVSIESTSPELLIEFHKGPGSSLKPVEIMGSQTAPIDSYVTFNAPGARAAFSSWNVEVKDENGKVQYFGPYTQDKVSMPGKNILGTRPHADYKVTMTGQMKNGKSIKQTVPVHMVLWTPPKTSEGIRYSVLYEFDESKVISLYDTYLSNVVASSIPKDATVIIHGYTDIIGDVEHNEHLSLERAQDVKNIISSALAKAGRTDVKFEVLSFGENEILAPFGNTLPEERSYNRTVLIDIIPFR